MKVLDGEPLSNGDFIIKLSTNEVSVLAWAAAWFSRHLSQQAHGRPLARQLADDLAELSGDH